MVETNASVEDAVDADMTGDIIEVLKTEIDASCKRKGESSHVDENSTTKRAKTTKTKMTEKQAERQRAKELKEIEKAEREKKKEEERLRKEEKKQRKLEERQRKEQEKELTKKQAEDEKLEKERKREEEKLERERKREEEKARKQAEKDERERLRLEKKRLLEEEKQRKEQEKQDELDRKRKKEERSQMKISSFFTIKPTPKAKTPSVLPKEKVTEDSTFEKKSESYYSKKFLPFFVKATARMIPSGALCVEDLEKSITTIDDILFGDKEIGESIDIFKSSTSNPETTSYTHSHDLVALMNSSDVSETQIQALIDNLPPIKYMEFYENAKPPFIGTWCSSKHSKMSVPAIDPLNETITGLDYSYDSDLDWNGDDDDEGEDIGDDDDEDDDDEDDDEEMVDFLDDAVEGSEEKKRKILGPLVSNCIWGESPVLQDLQYELLIPTKFPIEINRNYWEEAKEPGTPNKLNTIASSSTTPAKPMISEDKDIFHLIQFIEKNNEFSVNVLVELAKKELDTTYTKALVKSTIQSIASYSKKMGKWEIKQEIRQLYYSKFGS